MDRREGKADLHLHTAVGDALPEVRDLLDYVQECTDLDVIAITDHDEIEGGWMAREIMGGRQYRFEVIVGTEITTQNGHLLALFLERPVRSFRPLRWTIDAVHDQGGLCVVPHPLSWLTLSVGERALERAMSRPGHGVDGLETANGTIAGRVTQERVKRLNQARYHLPETGGSDAHFLPHVGAGYTLFPGRTAADLRQALLDRSTRGALASHPGAPVPWSDLARQQVRSMLTHPWKKARRALARVR